MYIKKIVLKNIRCFADVTIDLSSEKGAKKWLLIVGDNNVGKTSLLRAIAMGLCDQTRAASLLGDTYGQWIRKDAKEDAVIELDVWDGKRSYSIKTHIYKSASGLETVKRAPKMEKKFPWEKMFVCGYGANRSIEGNISHDAYSMADAVYTLFNYDYPSQHPELMLRRIAGTKQEQRKICNWLEEVLMLSKGSIKLTFGGLSLTSKSGHEIPWGAFGGGYESMITLLLDMLGWALLAGLKNKGKNVQGIVLIDELEQHLHPELQRNIIRNLHEVFPHIQFIASSHSPICAAGLADLPDKKCDLERLMEHEEGFVINEKLSTMSGWRYDRILRSEAFGVPDRNVKTQQLMDQVHDLYMKEKMTAKQASKLKNLMKRLKKESPIGAEAESLRMVDKEISRIMRQLEKRGS